MPALARLHALDQQLVGRRNPRPLALHLEQRANRLHLRSTIDAALRFSEPRPQTLGELTRQWQPTSHPARNRALGIRRSAHPRLHVAHAHELEWRPREHEAIA